jgi:glutaredoxin 3
MLYLYYKPSCPYCQRVLEASKQIDVTLKLLDVGSTEELREELIIKGGKKQVPFLVDESKGMMMYESGDIIDYLVENYGSEREVKVPPPGNVCPID